MKLPIGEKLRQVRKAKELSIANIAYASNLSESTISRIERGDGSYSTPPQELVDTIKLALGIPSAPLEENELAVFISRLWVCNDMINSTRVQDTLNGLEALAVIEDLPFEADLMVSYSMVKCRVLLTKRDFLEVKERLVRAEKSLDTLGESASSEARQLFHKVSGNLCQIEGDFNKALEHGLKALDYANPHLKMGTIILLDIGNCYYLLGKPIQSLIYFERSLYEYGGDNTSIYVSSIRGALAARYYDIGDIDKAEKLHEESLLFAKGINNRPMISACLQELGVICGRRGNHQKALDLSNQALEYASDFKQFYVLALIKKGMPLVRLKQFEECGKLIAEGRALLENNEGEFVAYGREYFHVHFNVLECLMNLKDSKSLEYLEEIAIPQIMKKNHYTVALELCDILEEHYRKTRSKTKELTIGVMARDIWRSMVLGPGIK